MIGLAIFLFVVGLFMICLEIFIPGGITGTAGAGAVLASFWIAYTRVGSEFGIYFIALGLVLVMVGIFASMLYFPKTSMSERVFLRADQKGFNSSGQGLQHLVGMEGLASTRMRPSGIARIDGKRYSVVADDYIEAGEKIVVTGVQGSRIAVKQISGKKES